MLSVSQRFQDESQVSKNDEKDSAKNLLLKKVVQQDEGRI